MKFAIVTGTRAEYGILKPLLKSINCTEGFRLQLIVTGTHLIKDMGFTIKDIKKDNYVITDTIEMYKENIKDARYYGNALARGIYGFTKTFVSLNPDWVIVYGDRLEMLAATLAAATLAIPIAHIYGGDKTDSGHIDESIRHSITRFANIHFTATKEHSDRLIKMGEEPWRIYKVGALSLDNIMKFRFKTREETLKELGLDYKKKIMVCLFHPYNIEKLNAGKHMRLIMEALNNLNIQTVMIYPNNDAGNQEIIREIEKNRNKHYLTIFKNLPYPKFINLVKNSDALIGNSSSGIVETPSLKVAAINIGERNRFREKSENIIFVDVNKKQIIHAIKKALFDERFKKQVNSCKNRLGDGNTNKKIINVLKNLRIEKRLMQKKITY